jgi:hypothetical protein
MYQELKDAKLKNPAFDKYKGSVKLQEITTDNGRREGKVLTRAQGVISAAI